jgi:hypothetical protein
MTDKEDTKQVELVLREPVKKLENEIENKVEKAVALSAIVGIDESAVKTIIVEKVEEVKTVVTTVQIEKIITEKLGLKMITESTLSEGQKNLATQIYDPTKASLQGFILDMSLNNTLKITKTIGQIIKQLENVKVNDKAPSGNDKKIVAIHLGRILIKEITPDDKGEAEILMVYDLIAEPTLEAMIDVSKAVNTAVQEIATKCCPSLFDMIKSLLRK